MKLSRKRRPTKVRIRSPTFPDLAPPGFMWGDMNGSAFSVRVDEAYE